MEKAWVEKSAASGGSTSTHRRMGHFSSQAKFDD